MKYDDDEAEVSASTDVGTAGHDQRHFIDRAFLENHIPGGGDLITSLVTPTPPCTRLTGTKKPGGETVVGMLPDRLKVSCHFPLGCAKYDVNNQANVLFLTKEPVWLDFQLQNVLVVDSLPVPLHISLKALGVDGRSNYVTWEKGLFPVEYHTHYYWSPEGRNVYMVGSYAVDPEGAAQMENAIAEGATGQPNRADISHVCGQCGKSGASRMCITCEQVYYCDTSCQMLHWQSGGHREACRPVDEVMEDAAA